MLMVFALRKAVILNDCEQHNLLIQLTELWKMLFKKNFIQYFVLWANIFDF